MKAADISAGSGVSGDLTAFLGRCLEDDILDAVMIPVEGPNADSFPWMLIEEPSHLSAAVPLPPVMQVQGAAALRSAAAASGERRIAAVLRPCESRAVVELSKLEQLDLDRILLLSADCQGVAVLSDFADGTSAGPDWSEPETLRPVCRMCTEFTGSGDIRVAIRDDHVFLAPLTDAGSTFLESSGLKADSDAPESDPGMEERKRDALAECKRVFEALSDESGGLDGLVKVFSGCNGCRNGWSIGRIY